MKRLTSTALSFIIFAALVVIPAMSLAEVAQDQGAVDSTGTIKSVDRSENTGINTWWLLPLIAIPLVFLGFRKTSDELESDRYDDTESLVGVKGGSSSSGDDDEYDEDV